MKFCTFQQFLQFFTHFDLYKSYPTLLIKKSYHQTKFASCLSFSFLFLIALFYLTPLITYFQNYYIQTTDQTITTNLATTRKTYITNKNFYLVASLRQRATGKQIDPSNDINQFMLAQLLYTDLITGDQSFFSLENRNCNTYLNNFLDAPKLNYCLTLPDKIQIITSIQKDKSKQFTILFQPSCNNFILCSGSYYNALSNKFISFWRQYTYVIYFTTRILDSNNKVIYKWNEFSSNQYVQVPTSVNFVSVGISNLTYYVDNSILPWKYNKTHYLEAYFAESRNYVMPSSNLINYGVQISFYSTPNIYIRKRFYMKVDYLLGILGGGIFLLYLIFRCFGTSYNRFWSRIQLTKELYTSEKGDGKFSPIDVSSKFENRCLNGFCKFLEYTGILQFIKIMGFMMYRFLGLRRWECLNKYGAFIEIKKYEQIFDSCNNDRQITNICKSEKKMRRSILQKQQRLPHNLRYFRKLKLVMQQLIDKQNKQGINSFLLNKQQNPLQQYIIQQFNQQQLNTMENLNLTPQQYNLLETINQNHPIYLRYFKHNPLYLKTFKKNTHHYPTATSAKYSKVYQQKSSSSFISNFSKIIKHIDIFKIYPSFVIDHTQSYGTFIGFLSSLATIILSVLTFYIGFSYFLQKKNYQISSQVYDTNYSNFNINVITNDSFIFGLCFMSSSGLATNFDNFFKTQSKIQLYQYDRVGTIISNSSYPLQTVKNISYFNAYYSTLSNDYANCYKVPDGIALRITGSPSDYIQSYFSIRIQQYCYNPNVNMCSSVNSLNRQSNLNLYNNFQMKYFMSQAKYNSLNDNVQYNLIQGSLLLQRGNLNSSVVQQLLADQLRIIDDKTIWREDSVIRSNGITTKTYYNNYADIQPFDTNNLTYQLFFRPSGKKNQYKISALKADLMFGMIGGIFLFMIGVFHTLATNYNKLNFKIFLSEKLYKLGDNTVNFLKIWLYILFYPIKQCFRYITLVNRLYIIKKLDDLSSQLLNIDYIIKKQDILMRHLKCQQQNQYKRQLNQVYLKQQLNEKLKISFEDTSTHRSQSMMSNQFGANQVDNIYEKKLNGEIVQIEMQTKKSLIQGQKDQKESKKKPNKRKKQINDLTQLQQKQSINDKYQQFSNKNTKISILQQLNLNQPTKFKIKKQDKCNSFKKSAKQKLSSFLTFFDIFSTPGDLYFNGSPKYGTCCGGCFSLIAIVLIFATLWYFGNLYLNSQNYVIYKNTDQINSNTFQSKFVSDSDFRFAIAFIDRFSPNFKNISINVTGASPLLNLSVIQSIVNRNITTLATSYSEILYRLVPCPQNYLNDQKFTFLNYSVINIQNAYCLPNGIELQFFGDINSAIQKWFMVSVAVNCGNLTSCTARITNGSSFFNNHNMRYFISTPIIKSLPIKYKFIQQPFVYLSRTASQVNNVTINPSIYINDDQIYPWSKKLNLTTYQYVYNGAQDNIQNYAVFNNRFSKNLTFTSSYVQSIYTRNVMGINAYFGTIGGIIAFIMFIFGIFIWKFNQLSLYYQIGKKLYICETDFQKSKSIKTVPNIGQFKLFLFMVFYYSCLSKLYQKVIPAFNRVNKTIQNVKKQINFITFIKGLMQAQNCCNRLLYGKQKNLLKIYFKKIIQNEQETSPFLKNNIAVISKKQIQDLVDRYQISQYQLNVIYNAIKNNVDIKIFGRAGQFLNKYIKIQIQLELKRRNNLQVTHSRFEQQNSENVLVESGRNNILIEDIQRQGGDLFEYII